MLFRSFNLALSMSTVREYGTVRRTFKCGTVRYGSFANTYLLDRTFSEIDLQISFTNFIYVQISFTNLSELYLAFL